MRAPTPRFPPLRPRRRGFTLVELIAVVLIVGVLAAIAVVAYSHVTTKGKVAAAAANVRQVSTAVLARHMLDQEPMLTRAEFVEALDSLNVDVDVTPWLSASAWTFYGAGQSPLGEGDFAVGFDTGPGTPISNERGTRVVVLAPAGDQLVAQISSYTATGGSEHTSQSLVVRSGTTPTQILTGTQAPDPSAPPVLQAPTLTGTAGSGRVSLDWTAATGATGFRVALNGELVAELGADARSYEATDLPAGVGTWAVAAVRGTDVSWSTDLVLTVTPPSPAAPTDVSAVGTQDGLLVLWTPAAGATSYDVFVDGVKATVEPVTSPPATIGPLPFGSSPMISVSANNAAGTSPAAPSTTGGLVGLTPTSLKTSSGIVDVAAWGSDAFHMTSTQLVRCAGGPTGACQQLARADREFSAMAINPSNGDIYAADKWVIQKVTQAGVKTFVAGSSGWTTTRDGSGANAGFATIRDIDFAPDGTGLYVSDVASIRKVTLAGVVTTIAGPIGSQVTGHVDASGTAARFLNPRGIAATDSGVLYVSDQGYMRQVDVTSKAVSTIAGVAENGMVDGAGTSARLRDSRALSLGSDGNVYFVHSDHVRRLTPSTGQVRTISQVPGGALVGLALRPDGTTWAASSSTIWQLG